MKLLLARHGETDFNARGLIQGQTDIPLNEIGREQARDLANRLRPYRIVKIFTSPLVRARETAEIIHASLDPRTPIVVEPALKERAFGPLEGKPIKSLSSSDIEFLRQMDHAVPDGVEPLAELKTRVIGFLTKIQRDEATKLTDDDSVLVVSHMGLLRIVFSSILKVAMTERSKNCAISEILVTPAGFKPLKLNDAAVPLETPLQGEHGSGSGDKKTGLFTKIYETQLKPKVESLMDKLGTLKSVQKAIQGRNDLAVLELREKVKEHPESESAWEMLCALLNTSAQHAEGTAIAQQGLVHHPRNARLWRLLGQHLLGLENKEAAEIALRKALEIDPALASAWIDLGTCLLSMNDTQGAESAYRKATTNNLTAPTAWLLLGSLQQMDGREAEARESFLAAEDANRIPINNAPVSSNSRARAMWYNDAGWRLFAASSSNPVLLQQALVLAERSIEFLPIVYNWDTKACVLAALGRWQEAREAFLAAIAACRHPGELGSVTWACFRPVLEKLGDTALLSQYAREFSEFSNK